MELLLDLFGHVFNYSVLFFLASFALVIKPQYFATICIAPTKVNRESRKHATTQDSDSDL